VNSHAAIRGLRVGRGFGSADTLVLAVTIIWGGNVVVGKLALANSGPLTYAALRYILGGLTLYGLARCLEGPLAWPRGTDARLIGAAALVGVLISQASFTVALALTNPDNVAMISGTTPLLVAGWLAWRGREHFGAKVWGGLGLGLVGLVLVVGAGRWSSWLGVVVAFGNPASWALYLLLLPRLLGRYRPLTLAALVTLFGGLMLVPFGAVDALTHHVDVTWSWLGLVAYSALVGLAFTSWPYVLGVRRLGPARTAVYSYLQPLLSVVAALVVIGEPLQPLQLLGGVILVVGVLAGRPRPRPVAMRDEPMVFGRLPTEGLADADGMGP
jgi:drug/metabolite transporter (DMT)-like permease